MTSGKRVTPEQINSYWEFKDKGYSQRRASAAAGFSIETAKRLEKERKETGWVGNAPEVGFDHGINRIENNNRAFNQKAAPDWPLALERTCEQAQEAMADKTGFRYAKRYAGIELSRWQQIMWQQLLEGWYSEERDFKCVNAPPGLGKSTVLVVFASRITVEFRDVRGLFMSRAYSLAERNTLRLRRMLERTAPFVNGESTLAVDFGRFRARTGELWRRNEFVVEQFDGSPIEEKEPTWAAFGFDAEWLGNRLDILIGDDLDSSRTVRNMETVEQNRIIFDNELEPRVEKREGKPGGLMVVAQQRLGPFDFSSHVLAKVLLPDDDGVTEDPEGEPMYEHIVFKAHYEDKCKGVDTHHAGAESWPDGCLLDRRQLSYRDLRKVMRNRLTFELVYQQNDMVAETGLVKRMWLDGGRDPKTQIMYPGCWDDDRDVWQLPMDKVTGQTTLHNPVGIITVDPSASNFWAIEAWVFSGEQRFLLDLKRERLEAPDFLDWSHGLNEFTGIAEDWRILFGKLGVPLSWVVVEMNAAQRFMLQYSHFHRWMESRAVQVIAHSTQRNKQDADFGVQMLGPKYERGEIRLPGAQGIRGNPHHSVMRLVNEVLRYPNSATIDCVMAQWFGEFNADKLYAPPPAARQPQWRPSWLVPTG